MNHNNQLTQTALANMVHLATYICEASAAFIYFIPSHKALQSRTLKFGWVSEPIPLDSKLYELTLSNHDVTILNSVHSHPELINDPFLVLYPQLDCWIGVPLQTSTNHILGMLCILDTISHEINATQKQLLTQTSQQIMLQIEIQGQLNSATETIKKMEERQERSQAINDFLIKLQSINSKQDFYNLLERDLPHMLASPAGKIYTFSGNFLNARCVVRWGNQGALMDDSCTGENSLNIPSSWFQSLQEKSESKPDGLTLLGHQALVANAARCDPDLGCYILLSSHEEQLGLLQLDYTKTVDVFKDDELFLQVIFHISATLYHLNLLENLRVKSLRDSLTGLFNRRYMLESLEKICRASTSGLCISIILLDIDHFKHLNDTFGHPAGDTVLREFGSFLQGYVRRTDIACRYGGEEFLLILSGVSLTVAYRRAESLRKGLSYLKMTHDGQFIGSITVSIGIATAPQHGQTPETLLQAADTALYEAKRKGRNRSVCAHSVNALPRNK